VCGCQKGDNKGSSRVATATQRQCVTGVTRGRIRQGKANSSLARRWCWSVWAGVGWCRERASTYDCFSPLTSTTIFGLPSTSMTSNGQFSMSPTVGAIVGHGAVERRYGEQVVSVPVGGWHVSGRAAPCCEARKHADARQASECDRRNATKQERSVFVWWSVGQTGARREEEPRGKHGKATRGEGSTHGEQMGHQNDDR
jgi:hypothetical protein